MDPLKMYIFPIKNGDIAASYVSLPESTVLNSLHTHTHTSQHCILSRRTGSRGASELASIAITISPVVAQLCYTKYVETKHVDFLMFATHIGSIVLPTFFETCKVCSMLYAVIRHVFFHTFTWKLVAPVVCFLSESLDMDLEQFRKDMGLKYAPKMLGLRFYWILFYENFTLPETKSSHKVRPWK